MKKLDVSLHADEPLRTGLLRVVDCLIENAVNRIKWPSHDRGEDVHLVRVTVKRLRAILRLLRPVISKTAFERENIRLRTAARRLSASRDADVARQTLATLRSSKTREGDGVTVAFATFGNNGEPDISKSMSQIGLDLERTRQSLHRLRISGREWKAIEPGLREVYRQCRRRMRRALGQGDDDAFHKWRIRVKNLYYELQMLQPVWPDRLNKMVAGLAELQDKIGADHDLAVLKRSLQKSPDTFGGSESVEQILNALNNRRRKLKLITEPLGKTIFDQKSSGFVREMSGHWTDWRRIALPEATSLHAPSRRKTRSCIPGRSLKSSIGLVTAINPVLGYEKSAAIAKEALQTGRPVYDLVLEKGWLSKEALDTLLRPENMTQPREWPANK